MNPLLKFANFWEAPQNLFESLRDSLVLSAKEAAEDMRKEPDMEQETDIVSKLQQRLAVATDLFDILNGCKEVMDDEDMVISWIDDWLKGT